MGMDMRFKGSTCLLAAASELNKRAAKDIQLTAELSLDNWDLQSVTDEIYAWYDEILAEDAVLASTIKRLEPLETVCKGVVKWSVRITLRAAKSGAGSYGMSEAEAYRILRSMMD